MQKVVPKTLKNHCQKVPVVTALAADLNSQLQPLLKRPLLPVLTPGLQHLL